MSRVGHFAVGLETISDDVAVATVEGELDMATSPELERTLAPVAPAGRLVIDLSACTFADSSAIRVLAACAHTVNAAGGSVAVVAADGGIRRALEIAAIDTVVRIHETRSDALT